MQSSVHASLRKASSAFSVRSLAALSSSPAASTSRAQAFNPSFPCIDAHEQRESKLVQQARDRGTTLRRRREPLASSFPEMETKDDPKGEEPSYSVRPPPPSLPSHGLP